MLEVGKTGADGETRRRGRPLANQIALRDAAILDVAEALFLDCGYRQVSLALIAKSAGVATRTIYARFGGKMGVLDKIIERRDGTRSLDEVLAETHGDARAGLLKLAAHAFQFELSLGSRLLQADALAARSPAAISGIPRLLAGPWYDGLIVVLETGQWELGYNSAVDRDILVDLFVGCLVREYASATASRSMAGISIKNIATLAESAVNRLFRIVRWKGAVSDQA